MAHPRITHAILFDIDGTLVSGGTSGIGRKAMELAFEDVHNKSADDYPKLKEIHVAGSTDFAILDRMAQTFEVSTAAFEAAYPDFEAAYLDHLRRMANEPSDRATCPGVLELMNRLDARPSIVLALLTGNTERGARIKLAPYGLDRFFESGGFGSDSRNRGEMARIARGRIMQLTGANIKPDHVVVVGDTVHDVAAGKANGFITAGVTTGSSSRETLEEAGADCVFSDFTPGNGFESWLRDEKGFNLEPDPI